MSKTSSEKSQDMALKIPSEMEIFTHALKSHMTTIIGFMDVLMDEENITPPQKEYLDAIQKTSWALIAELNRVIIKNDNT